MAKNVTVKLVFLRQVRLALNLRTPQKWSAISPISSTGTTGVEIPPLHHKACNGWNSTMARTLSRPNTSFLLQSFSSFAPNVLRRRRLPIKDCARFGDIGSITRCPMPFSRTILLCD